MPATGINITVYEVDQEILERAQSYIKKRYGQEGRSPAARFIFRDWARRVDAEGGLPLTEEAQEPCSQS